MKSNFCFPILASLSICILILSGCGSVSVPKAAKEYDLQAKTFSTKANMSNIYLYRLSTGSYGKELAVDLTLDEFKVGKLGLADFAKFEVQPGVHTAELNSWSNNDAHHCVLKLETEAGRNYFVNFEFWAKCSTVDETVGKAEIEKSKLILIPESVVQVIADKPALPINRAIHKTQQVAIDAERSKIGVSDEVAAITIPLSSEHTKEQELLEERKRFSAEQNSLLSRHQQLQQQENQPQEQSLAEDMREKSKTYTEVGLLTADGINIINVSFVHRWDNTYGYASIGYPLLLDYGFGISSMPDGSGLNFRIGIDYIAVIWNSSITYNFRIDESNSFEAGVGFFQLINFCSEFICGGSYPVLSYRHQW